jgi:tRNA-splicing ligase RtcB
MTTSTNIPIRSWLTEPLSDEAAKSIERLQNGDDSCYLAIMPDVHLAADVCVGVVFATTDLIYPAAVGSDIGCGMTAVAFDANAELLDTDRAAAQLLAALYDCVTTNKHAKKPELPSSLAQQQLTASRLAKRADRDGRVQLGTLGRGNHFLELQSDGDGQLWMMVHSGSRAMGQLITSWHLQRCVATPNGLAHLSASTDAGRAYLADVLWARAYAGESRMQMLRSVSSSMRRLFSVDTDWSSLLPSYHNHVQFENHFGRSVWVHRQGAQSARSAEMGLIPGSMGTSSFHVAGRGMEESLRSCSHGAGRRQSRTDARNTVGKRDLLRPIKHVWSDQRRTDSLRDEAPSAYRDIHKVIRAQRELVSVVRELRPLLTYKGG